MDTATQTSALDKLEQARKQIADEAAHDAKLMQNACLGVTGTIPKTLGNAAIVITNLRNERDIIRKDYAKASEFLKSIPAELVKDHPEAKNPPSLDNAKNLIKRLVGEKSAVQDKLLQEQKLVNDVLAQLVEGQPEASNTPTVKNVKNCLDRLTREARDNKVEASKLKPIIDNIKATLMDRGLKELAGTEGYFTESNTPLMNFVEAASLAIYGDDLLKSNFVKKNGWIRVGTAENWKDPLDGKNITTLKYAFDTQVKRLAKPFEGMVRDAKQNYLNPPKFTAVTPKQDSDNFNYHTKLEIDGPEIPEVLTSTL